jgi:hypothetical protein
MLMKPKAKQAAAIAISLPFASTLDAQITSKPSTAPSTDSAVAPLPSWSIGPFNRQPDPQLFYNQWFLYFGF